MKPLALGQILVSEVVARPVAVPPQRAGRESLRSHLKRDLLESCHDTPDN